jgi:allophanate hydrolase
MTLRSLDLATLGEAYQNGLTPSALVREVVQRCDSYDDPAVWIDRVAPSELEARAHDLERAGPQGKPLYGVPFAIKDNIDVAGRPTTAACPAFAYTPDATAPAVQRLLDAGAILIGKTNLDQFATGLVGTRSPYGACRNPLDPRYIAGGSSSGSAVAVAAGLVSFALGTDTAGSGRVPASFCNLVGVKPTRGLVSTRGVVPACRSLDCVSIFALCCNDGAAILDLIEGFDRADPFSRPAGEAPAPMLRVGVPADEQLVLHHRDDRRLFARACARLERLGIELSPIDFGPLFETASLLYEGPWVAERYLAVQELIEQDPDALLPVTRNIIERGREITAAETFAGFYRLAELRRAAEAIFDQVDGLVVPTAPTVWTRDEVAADPVRRNSLLGTYTNFVNLLDLAALAVPAGFRQGGLPFGITLIGRAFSDRALLDLGGRLHAGAGHRFGTSTLPVPEYRPIWRQPGRVCIAVCGAHMQGMPLNHELTERQGRLLARTRTAPCYRLYVLPGNPPQRPGLVRCEDGAAIEVEVWDLPLASLDSLVQSVPAPLAIATLTLVDGSAVQGFVAEAHATHDALDITHLGGWRQYLAEQHA